MVTCFNGYASGDKFFKTLAWKTVSMRCLNGSILVFTFETKLELLFFCVFHAAWRSLSRLKARIWFTLICQLQTAHVQYKFWK